MASTVAMEMVGARRTVGGIDRFAVHGDPPPHPLVRAPAARGRIGVWVGAALIGIAAASRLPWDAGGSTVVPEIAQAGPRAEPSPPAVVKAGTASPWGEVNRPIQLFNLTGSAFGKLPLTYRARRRADESERQDTLVYGSFGGEAPVLALSILRRGRGPEAAPFFVDLARLAADQGLAVGRSGLPTLVTTRFGGFETADVSVGQGAKGQPCLSFRLRAGPDDAGLIALSGLACGTPTKPMDREGLACVLDRVDLVSAGDDTDLRAFFVEAERRRGQGCGGSHLLAAGSRQTWLDGEAIRPPLKPSGAAGKPSRRAASGAAEL